MCNITIDSIYNVAHNTVMKITSTKNAKLVAVFEAYRQLPNMGATLTVSPDGKIGNGMVILASFKSKSSACRQLRKAGFLPLHDGSGWRIYPSANARNAENTQSTFQNGPEMKRTEAREAAQAAGAGLITEDEYRLLVHMTRWGLDGCPVKKVGSRKWSWDFCTISASGVYNTRREAIESFAVYYTGLLNRKAGRVAA